jgi:DNA-directed RNA polymerase specialized sigma24 family protein
MQTRPITRTTLRLCYGLSYEEIATVTSTSYTAVNRWMARGRKALRAARASDEHPARPAPWRRPPASAPAR